MAGAGLRPSFFEVLAAEQLDTSLYPAVMYALDLGAVRHRFLRWVWERRDEAYLILALSLEGASLRRDGATICEGFYSLRRAPSNAPRSGVQLTAGTVLASLLWRVLVPYARRKLTSVHNLARTHSLNVTARRGGVLRTILLRYPSISGVADALAFAFRLVYLVGGTQYYSPSLWLQGIILRRSTGMDVAALARKRASASGFGRALGAVDGFATVLKYACFAALVTHRFFEHVSAAAAASASASATTPAPPAPRPPLRAQDSAIAPPSDLRLCPICQSVRTAPAALLSSGYVFCYSCILGYVREYAKCPVTGMEAKRSDICRVYHG